MYCVILNLVVLFLSGLMFWKWSSFDPRLTDENLPVDYARRGLRCGVSLILVEISFLSLWEYVAHHDPAAGIGYLLAAMPLTFIWFSCLSAYGAHLFNTLIDPEDKRPFHPRTEIIALDGIADLIRHGKTEEAIRLCEALKATGEVNPITLELTLEHLGVPQSGARILRPLTEADRLRSQGKFAEAELILQSLLLKNPRDFEAAMLLMRLYAQDLHQPLSATLVLQTLEKQPRLDPAHLDFARRSIEEWSRPAPPPPTAPEPPPPAAVDDLLAQGFLGTAIETLERQIKDHPGDFDLRLKLAETQALRCKNFALVEKMIRQMENQFSPEQIQLARLKLREWRDAHPG